MGGFFNLGDIASRIAGDNSDEPSDYPGGGGGATVGAPVTATSFEEVSVDEGALLALAYGEHLVAGSLVYYKRVEGPPPSVTAFYAQGEGEWDSVIAAWYAGEALTSIPLTDNTTPGYHFHRGTLSTGPTDAVQGIDSYVPGGLTYNKTAYTAVRLPEKFSTEERPDKLRGRYRCRKVWNYNSSGTPLTFAYSVNPADVAMDVIRRSYEQRYNGDLAAALVAFQARIDWATYTTWRNYCAATISWNDGTTTRDIPRFEAHMVFLQPIDLPAVLDAICGISCSRWQDDGEKLRFLIPTDTTSQHTFNENNIVMGSIASRPKDIQAAPRHILARFRDLIDPYLGETSAESRREPLINAFGDLISERSFPNMNHSQAQRILEYQFRLESDFRQLLDLTAKGDSLHLLPGDFVTVNLANVLINGSYMILEATDNSAEKTPDERQFSLQRIESALYADADHHVIQRPITPPDPNVLDPNLVLWLAAWKETGYVNADRLATLNDFSSGAHHFTQATAANKPRFDTGILNGQPGFFFDGLAYFAESTAFMTGDCDMMMVLKIPGSQSGDGFMKFDGSTVASHCLFSGDLYTAFGAASRISYTPSSMTAGYIHHIQAKAGTNNWIAYQNGNNVKNTRTDTQSWYGGATPKHLIGASSDQPNGSTQTNFFHGWIMELKIWNKVLTTAERNSELAGFNARYGLAVTNF